MRLAIVLLAACGDGLLAPDARPSDARAPRPDAPVDAAIDTMPDGNPFTPPTLLLTGLCLDLACAQISPEVQAYVPRYPLWADTATKRRWIFTPPGAQIDTTDMNHWKFPVGTKFWKEFTRDGIRVETRSQSSPAIDATGGKVSPAAVIGNLQVWVGLARDVGRVGGDGIEPALIEREMR